MKICKMCNKRPATEVCKICGTEICIADLYQIEGVGEICAICGSKRNALECSQSINT